MTIPATISPVESQVLTVLGGFIQQVTGLPQSSIAQGQANRVPPPGGSDFVIMTPLRQTRLGTNETTYDDNVIVGSIAGAVLTVTAVEQSEGGLEPGYLLVDTVWPVMNVAPNTVLGNQISGTPGGVGTYAVSPSQTLSSETLYAGVRDDLVPTEYAMQVDVYGPNSGNNSKVIEGLFYSEYGTTAFAASGLPISPLRIDEARQVGFVSGEDQWVDRWMLEVRMQVDPTIGTPQQYFPEVTVDLHEFT